MIVQLLEYWRGFLKKHLAACIFILFALQPLMDILSFWLEHLGITTAPSLLLRMLVLVLTAAAGYLVSGRRKYYWYLAAVCTVFFILHAMSCLVVGYVSPVADLTNYVRVIQIPLYTICFISFLRADTRAFRWMNAAFLIVFSIITAVVIISVVTGTNPHTYAASQIGIIGWFSTTNSQASIISMIIPIVMCMAYRAKQPWVLAIVTALSCAQLYFIGTRLAYMAIFAATIGVIFVTAVCGYANKAKYIILAAGAVICLVFIKQSPMHQQQLTYSQTMGEKQSVLTAMSEQREIELDDELLGSGSGNMEDEEGSGQKVRKKTNLHLIRELNQIYVYYCSDMVQRFGIEKVIQECNYATKVSEMTGMRRTKIYFCSLLMDELPFTTKLFGIERGQMEFKGENYDVENDFHGIYFLYGAVGFILFLGFLAYFFGLIIWALVKDIRKYFTLDAGVYGISLLLAMINAYNTAGILRRPNASFYLSAILAVIYYLVKIKKYPPSKPAKKLQMPIHFGKKKKSV